MKAISTPIATWCLFAVLPLMAQEPPVAAPAPAENPDELDPIVIYGGYATPKMWKISKGDHVMWVLGDTLAPAGTTWRFGRVEAHVAESQLVIYPGDARPDIGFFNGIGLLTLLPAAYKAMTKIPDNKTLKDVLPPEVYERWRVLRTAYAPRDNDLERFRPSIAMEKLEEIIGERLGQKDRSAQPAPLPRGPALRPLVDKAAKQHHVKIRTMPDVEWKFEVKDARKMLKLLGGSSLVVDAQCVTQKLEYLERKIDYLKKNAAGTAQEKAPARVPDCDEGDEIPDTADLQKMRDDMQQREKLSDQQLDAEWIAAAQAALAKNKSTFAVLQIGWNGDVSHINGYVAKLRELGYEVEEPGSGGE
ncbi:MAG TPA: TraB/GumN family protein [Steroidobacteraceae bacterium]|nr:TraB/GumN family protein [Steroidobacteraceae bacterium]